ncbi:MAG: sigma 54-interacting transcriptional regulator [Desulfomonilaceae bacterium]
MKGNHRKPPDFALLPGARRHDPYDLTLDPEKTDMIHVPGMEITQSGSFDVTSLDETYLGKALQVIPVPALFLDSRKFVVYLNRASRVLFGENTNAIGTSFLVFFPESSARLAAESAIGRVFTTRTSEVIECAMRFEQTSVHARIHLRSVRRETGRFILVIMEDLSAEKKLLEMMELHHDELECLVRARTGELETSKNKLRSETARRKLTEKQVRARDLLFEAAINCFGDGFFVKDKLHRYVHVNPALERMWGVPRDSLMGKNDADIFSSEEFTSICEVEKRVLSGDVVETERGVVINGVMSVFNTVRSPLKDGTGKVIGVCGVVRDVTGHKADFGILERDTEGEPVSEAMKEVLNLALTVAKTDSTILLLGETGSGKDHLARFIHQHSRRFSWPFVSVNCAALPTDLLESELFGHEPGAFTGAVRLKRGQVELAEGGTLLLNEIGELPVQLQAKLLSFLDHRAFTRVGGQKEVRTNIRIIAATNRDLAAEVVAGKFRSDLFHRINVIPITAPPLRVRVEDIPRLARQILEELCDSLGIPEIPALSPSAELSLKHYGWPGNIRELRNVLERSLILKSSNSTSLNFTRFPGTGDPPNDSAKLLGNKSLNQIVRDVKSSLIREALSRSKGNKMKAAQMLGIPYVSLRHYLQSLSNDKKYIEDDEI